MWIDRKSTLNYLHVWCYPTEAKLFNTCIGKLDHKTVSYHFIGYPDKSKGSCFYCPDRYIEIVEMRHTIFLEDEVIRGSMVPREIRLEEKQVCVPTPLVVELFFSVPATITPMVQGNVVAEPVVDSPVHMAIISIVGSPMTEINEEAKHVFKEPIANHEEEQQQPPIQDVPHNNLLEDLRELQGQLSMMTTRLMLAKKFKWRAISPLLKKP
jgi:hypothetical protein